MVRMADRPILRLVLRLAMAPKDSDRHRPNRASSITRPIQVTTTTTIAKPPGSNRPAPMPVLAPLAQPLVHHRRDHRQRTDARIHQPRVRPKVRPRIRLVRPLMGDPAKVHQRMARLTMARPTMARPTMARLTIAQQVTGQHHRVPHPREAMGMNADRLPQVTTRIKRHRPPQRIPA